MARWPEGSRQRLQDAALELFASRGYASTTIDDIAARAGVSSRTFFRHFADKEEVLFDVDDRLLAVLVDGVRSAPAGAPPRVLLASALSALGRELEPDRAHLRTRAAVLGSDVALQGRDLAKQARWTSAIAEELTRRGVPPATAAVLAGGGAGAFRATYSAWLADDADEGLQTRLARALDELGAALSAPAPRTRRRRSTG